jgi:hypothetical protein
MVVPAFDVGRQCVFARVASGAVATIVTEGNGLGEGNIETENPCHRDGYLSHFESMGKAGALMIIRKNEYLGFTRKASKGRGVKNAVSVAFETVAVGIWIFWYCSVAATYCMGR